MFKTILKSPELKWITNSFIRCSKRQLKAVACLLLCYQSKLHLFTMHKSLFMCNIWENRNRNRWSFAIFQFMKAISPLLLRICICKSFLALFCWASVLSNLNNKWFFGLLSSSCHTSIKKISFRKPNLIHSFLFQFCCLALDSTF